MNTNNFFDSHNPQETESETIRTNKANKMWNRWGTLNGPSTDPSPYSLSPSPNITTEQQLRETRVNAVSGIPGYVHVVADDVWPTSPYLYGTTLENPTPLSEGYVWSTSPYLYSTTLENPTPLSEGEIHAARMDCSLTLEKCYDPSDPTLKFVDREDDLDFLCEGFKSRRALMSCGHAVTPMSLTNWCRRLMDQGESRFVCGQNGCNIEWSYAEVCKMALLTREEMEYFERAMAYNETRGNTRSCPGCRSSVVRENESDLRVRCSVCTANKRRIYDFCWQCLREWKGPAPRSDRCENDGCCNESLETLRTCPDIKLESVKCPSIRACPTCGILLQHDNTSCRDVVCPRCKVEFCFVCLKLTEECLKTSEELIECSSRVAPRQTSIPVWQKKYCKQQKTMLFGIF